MTVDLSKPAIFGLLNHAATATITGTSEAAGYDGDNLKVPAYSSGATVGGKGTWRSTSAVAQNRDFDLGSVKTDIEAIVLWGANLTDAATWRILGDDTAGFGSPEHDSGTIGAFDLTRTPPAGIDDAPPWGRPLIFFPPSTWSARYIRTTLTDTANPAGYLEASYASIGPALQLGEAVGFAPRDELIGEAGVAVSRPVQTLSFMHVSEAVRRQALALNRALLRDGRFGLVPRPADPASWLLEAMLCRLAVPINETAIVGLNKWDLTMQVEGVVD